MRYGSVCSGIEAATAAWHPLGWQPAFFSEIEAAPRAVLAHHYPDVPCHGDFTTIGADEYGAIDLLVGGTPCQSFSVAGLRGGLADDRGNLALQFLKLAERTRARWVVWENVPGVLSSSGGRDFGSILGGLVQLGYGFAYRVLDAQFFGVPQRRRRVFVVGHIGDWRRAAAVLFERHSLSGNPAPRRETGQDVAGVLASRASGGGGGPGAGTDEAAAGYLQPVRPWPADVAPTLNAAFGDKMGLEDQHALNGAGCFVPAIAIQERAVSENPDAGPDGCGFRDDGMAYTLEARTVPQAICFSAKDHGADASDIAPTLRAGGHSGSHANAGVMPAVAFADRRGRCGDLASYEGVTNTLHAAKGQSEQQCVAFASTIETMYGVSHADAAQTYPDQALRALREAVGEKAYSEWCAGILTAFRTPEVLQSAVHGSGFRRPTDKRNELGDDALPCSEDGRGGTVLALWQAGSDGRSPRGWQPPEQLASELVAHLSELPHQRASAARFLLGLWRASEGLGLLREALSALQEAWRPAHGEDQPTRLTSAVRRLTPIECERLMGFPDDFTLVPYRKGMMADGPRYKMLGNSMAVPVMAWIGQRIAAVEAFSSERLAA